MPIHPFSSFIAIILNYFSVWVLLLSTYHVLGYLGQNQSFKTKINTFDNMTYNWQNVMTKKSSINSPQTKENLSKFPLTPTSFPPSPSFLFSKFKAPLCPDFSFVNIVCHCLSLLVIIVVYWCWPLLLALILAIFVVYCCWPILLATFVDHSYWSFLLVIHIDHSYWSFLLVILITLKLDVLASPSMRTRLYPSTTSRPKVPCGIPPLPCAPPKRMAWLTTGVLDCQVIHEPPQPKHGC